MPAEAKEEQKEYLNTDTYLLKLVSDYSGLNFNEAMELDCVTYKKLSKDAFIHSMSRTEEGREYLEQCWILNQTNPDREKLRKKFKED